MGHIVHPAGAALGQGGDRQQGQKDIGCGRRHDGAGQDKEIPLGRVFALRRGMGNGLKAHIGPGRQGKDGKGAVQAGVLLGIGRVKQLHARRRVKQGAREAEDDAADEHQRHGDLHPLGQAPVQADPGSDAQGQHGKQDLAHVHMEARDLIVEAELEQPAKQRAGDQGQGGGVGPDDGDIRQDQEPRADEAMVVAIAALGIGIGAAAVGAALHQKMEVCRQQQHGQRAQADAQGRAHRARDGQEGGAGHDKGPPAHSAAKRQGPGAPGGKICFFAGRETRLGSRLTHRFKTSFLRLSTVLVTRSRISGFPQRFSGSAGRSDPAFP